MKKPARKPVPWWRTKSRYGLFPLAQIDSRNNASLASVGWTLEDAKKLHVWLGKFIAWREYRAELEQP